MFINIQENDGPQSQEFPLKGLTQQDYFDTRSVTVQLVALTSRSNPVLDQYVLEPVTVSHCLVTKLCLGKYLCNNYSSTIMLWMILIVYINTLGSCKANVWRYLCDVLCPTQSSCQNKIYFKRGYSCTTFCDWLENWSLNSKSRSGFFAFVLKTFHICFRSRSWITKRRFLVWIVP